MYSDVDCGNTEELINGMVSTYITNTLLMFMFIMLVRDVIDVIIRNSEYVMMVM